MQADEVTGWYGKLPSLGDFASRRLAPSFVEPWDGWLAAGLAAWRTQSPDGWLEVYMDSPSWRFVLMPGVLPGGARDGVGAWAGVLMPSVDRVGRYFPLTLVRPLPALPGDAAQLQALLGWLHRLDDLAVDALQDDWTVERLDDELARLGGWVPSALSTLPPGLPAQWATSNAQVEVVPADDVATLLAGGARDALLHGLHGKALWLCDDGAGRQALRITAGLPGAAQFAALLGRGEPHSPSNPLDPRGLP